jgi:hypothetical protein
MNKWLCDGEVSGGHAHHEDVGDRPPVVVSLGLPVRIVQAAGIIGIGP